MLANSGACSAGYYKFQTRREPDVIHRSRHFRFINRKLCVLSHLPRHVGHTLSPGAYMDTLI